MLPTLLFFQMNETEETYLVVNQSQHECLPHIFSVTARNDAGESPAFTIEESIPISEMKCPLCNYVRLKYLCDVTTDPIVSTISASQRVNQVSLNEGDINVTIFFQVCKSFPRC